MRGRKINNEIIDKMTYLRSRGNSLLEISSLLGVPKTTVFYYIKNVHILPEFQESWIGKRGGSTKRRLRLENQSLDEAINLIGNLTFKEKLLFISALYWAEGSKKDFGLSNTDPGLIRLFVNGLRELFQVTNERLRVSVRIYEDLDREKCLTFWSNVVGISKDKFINVNVLSGKKKGKLEFGMCRVRVSKGGGLLKKIIGIQKAMSMYKSP